MQLAPLYRRRAVVIVAPACMVASVLLYELAVVSPGAAGASASAAFPLIVASALLAGVGAALSILQWAELQACLNSLQIVLYVSGAFFLGSVIVDDLPVCESPVVVCSRCRCCRSRA